jgi:uncharacterized protein (DUF488 family)
MILTIGHSTHPIEQFLALLRAHGVAQLIDIRTIPKSRRNPQFNSKELTAALKDANVRYEHMPGLGGLRHPRKDSINTAWRNASFRGYADYIQTPQFDENLCKLIEAASERRTVIMCAEAVPWRCHRSMVADVLTARGIPVEHIMNEKTRKPHSYTPFARRRRNGHLSWTAACPLRTACATWSVSVYCWNRTAFPFSSDHTWTNCAFTLFPVALYLPV